MLQMIYLPDAINAVACLAMMACLAPVANLLAPGKHGWYRALVVCVTIALLVSFLDFFRADVQSVTWSTAILHSLWAVALVACRKRVWLFVRLELGAETSAEHPLRRTTDFGEFAETGG